VASRSSEVNFTKNYTLLLPFTTRGIILKLTQTRTTDTIRPKKVGLTLRQLTVVLPLYTGTTAKRLWRHTTATQDGAVVMCAVACFLRTDHHTGQCTDFILFDLPLHAKGFNENLKI